MQFVIFLRPCFVSETRKKWLPKYLVSESQGAPPMSLRLRSTHGDKTKPIVNFRSSRCWLSSSWSSASVGCRTTPTSSTPITTPPWWTWGTSSTSFSRSTGSPWPTQWSTQSSTTTWTRREYFSLFRQRPIYFKNGPFLASFSFIFGLFQTNITNFTKNQCEKLHPVNGDGIWTHDLQNVSLLP